jgi:hypothetical protein
MWIEGSDRARSGVKRLFIAAKKTKSPRPAAKLDEGVRMKGASQQKHLAGSMPPKRRLQNETTIGGLP